jgi:hypothetical protein
LAKLASISSEWDDVPRAEDSSGFELKFKNAKNSPDALGYNQDGLSWSRLIKKDAGSSQICTTLLADRNYLHQPSKE